MAGKLMYAPNDDTQKNHTINFNYWLKWLNAQLNKPSSQNSKSVLKVVKPTNRNNFWD